MKARALTLFVFVSFSSCRCCLHSSMRESVRALAGGASSEPQASGAGR